MSTHSVIATLYPIFPSKKNKLYARTNSVCSVPVGVVEIINKIFSLSSVSLDKSWSRAARQFITFYVDDGEK